jgi:hypothetical protein
MAARPFIDPPSSCSKPPFGDNEQREIVFHDDTLMTVFQRLYPVLGNPMFDRKRPYDLEFTERRPVKVAYHELDLLAGGVFVKWHESLLLIR